MPLTPTQKCIRVVSERLLGSLKAHGFRRRVPHLWRDKNDVVHVINFQASQWGSKDRGSFTINLAVTNRELYELWTGKEFPTNPGSATWPINTRIGKLIENKDVWWDVTHNTDYESLAAEIVETYDRPILEFFEPFTSLKSLERSLSEVRSYGDVPGIYEAQAPLIRAIIHSIWSDKESAKRLLESSMSESANTPFASTVSTIASRLQIALD